MEQAHRPTRVPGRADLPIGLMLILSLKDNGQIYARFWSPPSPYRWENYVLGFLGIWRFAVNSLIATGASTVITVVLSAVAGFVFARHRFPGKEPIYTAIIALLMIPPILTLITTYNNFIWPLLVITDLSKQVISVGLTQFTSNAGVTDLGPQMAAYVYATVPVLVVFLFGMRYYIQGLVSGGLKA